LTAAKGILKTVQQTKSTAFMKLTLIKVVVIALLVGGMHHQGLSQLVGDTFAAAKQSKTATWVITHSDSPGLASMGADGKPDGACFDLMNAFAAHIKAKTGITITMKYQTENATDFTLFLKTVKDAKGGVFGLSNTTITEERKRAYRFSPPFIKNISMLISNSKAADLKDLKSISTSFADYTAITIKGSTNENRILSIRDKYYPKMQIENVSSFAKAVERVAADPKTFTCVDFTYYLKAIQSKKPIKRLTIGDEEGEEFGIVMPLSNDWSEQLAGFMSKEFLSGPQFNKIITDHLGQSVLKFTRKTK
jgi:Bacterial extracellular solute-binding proteins, family 3